MTYGQCAMCLALALYASELLMTLFNAAKDGGDEALAKEAETAGKTVAACVGRIRARMTELSGAAPRVS